MHHGKEIGRAHADLLAQVQVLGSQKYAMHAQLDPHALATRQVGINEVETALKNWNVNTPSGTIVGPHTAYTLQASGQLTSADQFIRLAGLFSVIAFVMGYDPTRFEDLIDTLSSLSHKSSRKE